MPPPDPIRDAAPRAGSRGSERTGWSAKYVKFDGTSPRNDCRCLDRLAHLETLVGQLCEHLDVDADLLEILARPTIAAGTPASWDECLALGIHPVSGEAL